MARPPGTARTPARWLTGALVGALVLGTATLGYLAVDHVRRAPAAAPAGPVPNFAPAPRPTTGPTDEPSPSTSAAPASTAVSRPGARETPPRALDRFLAIGQGVLWRATAGACGEAAPRIERSTDAGTSWQDVTPSYRGVAAVWTLDSFAGTQAEAVAEVGAGCRTQALRTFTQGRFWESYPDVLAQSRHLDPTRPGAVVTPDGAIDAPCADPRSVRASGEIVVLVCDGAAYRLADGTWRALAAADVAASAVQGPTVLTASVEAGCAGVAVTRWSGPDLATAVPLGCAPGADPAEPLALVGTTDGALVWSGDALIPTP